MNGTGPGPAVCLEILAVGACALVYMHVVTHTMLPSHPMARPQISAHSHPERMSFKARHRPTLHTPHTHACTLRDAVTALAFRDGTHTLLSGSLDRTVKLWSCDDRAYMDTLFGHQVTVFAFFGDPCCLPVTLFSLLVALFAFFIAGRVRVCMSNTWPMCVRVCVCAGRGAGAGRAACGARGQCGRRQVVPRVEDP